MRSSYIHNGNTVMIRHSPYFVTIAVWCHYNVASFLTGIHKNTPKLARWGFRVLFGSSLWLLFLQWWNQFILILDHVITAFDNSCYCVALSFCDELFTGAIWASLLSRKTLQKELLNKPIYDVSVNSVSSFLVHFGEIEFAASQMSLYLMQAVSVRWDILSHFWSIRCFIIYYTVTDVKLTNILGGHS